MKAKLVDADWSTKSITVRPIKGRGSKGFTLQWSGTSLNVGGIPSPQDAKANYMITKLHLGGKVEIELIDRIVTNLNLLKEEEKDSR